MQIGPLFDYILAFMCITASQIGKFLKTNGILKYIEKTWATIKLYWSAGHKAIKDSSPEYYKAIVDLSSPYIKLAGDMYLIMRNISVRLYNNAAAYFEKNIPVVFDTVSLIEILNILSYTQFFIKYTILICNESFLHRSNIMLQVL